MKPVVIEFSALTKPHWTESQRQQAKTVVDFVQTIMNNHDFEQILQNHQSHPYVQHNRTIAEGIEGVVATVRNFVKTAPEFSYDVKHVYVDGDCVILHSHATLKAKHRGDQTQGLNIIDIWRVKDGKPVEHWDAVEGVGFAMRLYGLINNGKVRNENGIF